MRCRPWPDNTCLGWNPRDSTERGLSAHTRASHRQKARTIMQGKIGLEEHFAIPETLNDSAGFVPGDYWKELSRRLLDIQDDRLRQMDENGMEMMLLSLNAPAV